MRRQLWIVTFILSLLPTPGQSQAQHLPPLPSETAYPYVVGLGAIAGMVVTQVVLFGSAGFPFFAGSVAPGTTIAAEVSGGISCMYAITSAVVGAWIANWYYDH